ncbi:unnamed protein product [Moneuplotes crassus]|uniref:Uncharacterized protein n=1 Tax=Euplotes crassus TaxID=5936 RepID=A0AAD1Y3U9_EUPCR|nr:unnamed protein product [Moneuplotes crassus]
MGIQLHFVFSHDDLDDGFMEPYEVSETLQKYTSIEIILQGCLTVLSVLFWYPYCFLYYAVMSYFNIKNWRKKKFTQHFMTGREYSKRIYIERVSKIKLIYYLVIVFFSLVFAMIKIAEILSKNMFGYGRKNIKLQ